MDQGNIATDLYQALGVDRSASKEEIRKAYRKRSKETHPDMPNGDRKAFERVSRALRILSDDKRREHYDRTGEEEEGKPIDNEFAAVLEVISQTLVAFASQVEDIEGSDLFASMNKAFDKAIQDIEQQLHASSIVMSRLKRMLVRISKKSKDGENYLKMMIEAQIAMIDRGRSTLEERMKIANRAKEMLCDYEYDIARPMMLMAPSSSSSPYQSNAWSFR